MVPNVANSLANLVPLEFVNWRATLPRVQDQLQSQSIRVLSPD
ncbi:Unknown protein sequence [Pseudomonas syringae pv. maculicola str. M6]|nr:Unknown protein sequence [Pseudomonas syringae pv. maculicola str. M6]